MDVWRSDGDDDDDDGGGCSTKWIHPKRDYLILLLNYRYENGGSVFVIIAGLKPFPTSRTSYRMNEWVNERILKIVFKYLRIETNERADKFSTQLTK